MEHFIAIGYGVPGQASLNVIPEKASLNVIPEKGSLYFLPEIARPYTAARTKNQLQLIQNLMSHSE